MISVNLKPEDVNAYITQAIVGSAIGEVMSERIRAALQDYKVKDAIDKVILQTISKIVGDKIEADQEFRARLEQHVKSKLTDDVVGSAVDKVVNRLSRDW